MELQSSSFCRNENLLENQSPRRRSSKNRFDRSSPIMKDGENGGRKMKLRFFSPKFCWRETTKKEKFLTFFALFLFFTGLYVAQTTLTKWKNTNVKDKSKNNDEILFPNILIDEIPISFNCDREEFNLKIELNELSRVKRSVLNELRSLEERRNVVRTEITILLLQSEKLQNELQQGVKDLEKIAISIEQAKSAYKEAVEKNMPEIYLPRKLHDSMKIRQDSGKISSKSKNSFRTDFCTMQNCFDYSRCSFVNGFTIRTVGFKNYSSNAKNSCVILINGTKNHVEDDFNQILIDNGDSENVLQAKNEPKIIASATFSNENYRKNFDLIIPKFNFTVNEENDEHFWIGLPPIVPARRKYLMTFFGRQAKILTDANDDETIFMLENLNLMQKSKTKDVFLFDFDCSLADTLSGVYGDWSLCFDETKRVDVLKQSTFSLVITPPGHVSSAYVQRRIQDALKYGAVPVILGTVALPFEEFLDWRKAAIVLPKARTTELHFFLRTFADADILELRRNGRIFWENYFKNSKKIIDSLLAVVRHRLTMPGTPIYVEESLTYFNETFQPNVADTTMQQGLMDGEEYLGPVELPYASPKYQQNFSLMALHAYDAWNLHANPLDLYEFNPFREPMPSEAKFEGSQFGFRPINNGAGGSGKEFSESLGGNYPREQFTIILLTYEREQVLLASLARLNNMPYLNKIIVIWNGPTPPAIDGVWPKVSAPVVVVKPAKNSLNNRFYPFAEIETEAVLSLDDDVQLRQDEIIFGFRVWREARDRVVGFPGRFHSWESRQWAYNSNHSCELSMVLTGAAFVHKYYLHLYTNGMAKSVRNKVDEMMNCEDIALNFLVSHMTRKPPIKVTSRWTFRCPGCPDTLSADDSHFNERHECINYFTRVYGYNPLLYTQFRVDSVLFKTKIPQNHQKCFKFI